MCRKMYYCPDKLGNKFVKRTVNQCNFIARTFSGSPNNVMNPSASWWSYRSPVVKGSKRLTVKAVWRSCTGFDDVSFVKLEFNFTGYIFLCGLNKCLDCFTKRCEPFSFVYNLSKLAAKFLSLLPLCHGQERVPLAGHELPSGLFRQESHKHHGISYQQHGFQRYQRYRYHVFPPICLSSVMISETFISFPFRVFGTPSSNVMVTIQLHQELSQE